jgi:hypothetical protein
MGESPQETSASSGKVTLKIPRPLYNRLTQLIEGSGYNSVTDFVVYVLRDIVSTHAVAHSAAREGERPPLPRMIEALEDEGGYTPEELEQVKERLRGLGYL